MLKEVKPIKQISGEPLRRWFASDVFDLTIWSSLNGHIIGFQLCYFEKATQKALTWRENSGFSHNLVEDGEERAFRPKMTPIIGLAQKFDPTLILPMFETESKDIDASVSRFVTEKLLECKQPSWAKSLRIIWKNEPHVELIVSDSPSVKLSSPFEIVQHLQTHKEILSTQEIEFLGGVCVWMFLSECRWAPPGSVLELTQNRLDAMVVNSSIETQRAFNKGIEMVTGHLSPMRSESGHLLFDMAYDFIQSCLDESMNSDATD